MFLASPRPLFLFAFLACVAIMGGALFLEHFLELEPCPLCIAQRIALIAFAAVCLIAALHGPKQLGRRLYAMFGLLFAASGAGFAGRQIWLQSVPADQLPACLPSLDYMMETLPFQEIIKLMLHGTADCAAVTWTLFGMSIPEWSLLAFAGFIIFMLYQILRRA